MENISDSTLKNTSSITDVDFDFAQATKLEANKGDYSKNKTYKKLKSEIKKGYSIFNNRNQLFYSILIWILSLIVILSSVPALILWQKSRSNLAPTFVNIEKKLNNYKIPNFSEGFNNQYFTIAVDPNNYKSDFSLKVEEKVLDFVSVAGIQYILNTKDSNLDNSSFDVAVISKVSVGDLDIASKLANGLGNQYYIAKNRVITPDNIEYIQLLPIDSNSLPKYYIAENTKYYYIVTMRNVSQSNLVNNLFENFKIN